MLTDLETPRLTLRELCLEDGPALQAYQSLPSNWQHQAVEPQEYSDGARVQRYLQYRGEGDGRRLFVFVARTTATGELVGEIGVSRTYPATLAVGFSVFPDKWGEGYATEMVRHALLFGFGHLKVHRITAAVAVENVACCRVLEKAGMILEGTSRECVEAQGRWWTEHQYAILAGDART